MASPDDRARVGRIEHELLAVLAGADGPLARQELITEVLDRLGCTPAERAELQPNGEPTWKTRVSMGITALGRDGRVSSPRRGFWELAPDATPSPARRPTSPEEDHPAAGRPHPTSPSDPVRPSPPAAAPRPSPSPVPPASWGPIPGWTAFVDHLIASERALQMEVRRTAPAALHELPPTHDVTLAHPVTAPALDDDALRFATDGDDDALLYGWPLVAVPGPARLRGPLFVVALELDDRTGRPVVKDARPWLNHVLVNDGTFDAVLVDDAITRLAGDRWWADPGALHRAARDVLEALGAEPAMVAGLGGPGGFRSAVVHDAACLARIPRSGAARTLIEDLEALRSVTDWQDTAAAAFLAPLRPVTADTRPGDATPPRPDARDARPGASDTRFAAPDAHRAASKARPAAPDARPTAPDAHESASHPRPPTAPVLMPRGLDLNAEQEAAVAAAATRPVTVVGGPPGTGKSQVVAAIAAGTLQIGERPGGSLLIASMNNPAVESATDRANDGRDGLVLRTGNGKVREDLKLDLERLAQAVPAPAIGDDVRDRAIDLAWTGRDALLTALEERAALHAEIARRQLEVEHLRERLWGPGATPPPDADRALARTADGRRPTFRARRAQRRVLDDVRREHERLTAADVARWAESEARLREHLARLEALPAYDADAERGALRRVQDDWRRASTEAVDTSLRRTVVAAHAGLVHLQTVRRSYGATWAAVRRLLPTMRRWSTSALSTRQNLPLEAGLFDLLVVDEASACRIATIVPLAYRARRIVVVGDVNQLAPVVTTNASVCSLVAAAAGTTVDETRRLRLSVQHDSAYTALAARVDEPEILLAEHYRCHPAIARYLNRVFYDQRLRILTPLDEDEALRGLRWHESGGGATRAGGGWTNPDEARAIVAWIAEHHAAAGSVGVVTPFAAQARLIDGLLAREDGLPEVLVATAHAFQGKEQDTILFSTVLAPGVDPRVAAWVEQQRNLVNVAVSRARRLLVGFGHRATLEAHGVVTLMALVDFSRGWLTAVEEPGRGTTPVAADAHLLHSEAEMRVHRAMTAEGLVVRLKPVVPYELDFHVHAGDPSLLIDVECDGSQHLDERGGRRRSDLVRDARLEDAGWTVLRYPDWRCLREPEVVAAEVAAVVRARAR